jgi:hypothetical protein
LQTRISGQENMTMNEMPQITAASLIAGLDSLYDDLKAALDQLPADLDSAPVDGWDTRHILSHIIGSLHRAPLQAANYLAEKVAVPIIFNDPYWLPEYESAPREAFVAALYAVIEGNKEFVRSLEPSTLTRIVDLPDLGEMSLGIFLTTSYHRHVGNMHGTQLRALLPVSAVTHH